MARSLWIDAKEAAEKPKWFARINELLDERLRLMALRDSKQ